MIIKPVVNKMLGCLGYEIRRKGDFGRVVSDKRVDLETFTQYFSPIERQIWNRVAPYTMTDSGRIKAVLEAVGYVHANNIEGGFVECGVWRGGSSMAAMLMFSALGDTARSFTLYDTYEGMSAPGDNDVTSISGANPHEKFPATLSSSGSSTWCHASIKDVEENVRSTGYPQDAVELVKGKVEQTIPRVLPGPISVLRLDTDWYESTLHEMRNLFPLVSHRGVVIIDDYDHWPGVRKAVDQYLNENKQPILLSPLPWGGRMGVKL